MREAVVVSPILSQNESNGLQFLGVAMVGPTEGKHERVGKKCGVVQTKQVGRRLLEQILRRLVEQI